MCHLENNREEGLSLTTDFVRDDIAEYVIISHDRWYGADSIATRYFIDSTSGSKTQAGDNDSRSCREHDNRNTSHYFLLNVFRIDKLSLAILSCIIKHEYRLYRDIAIHCNYLSNISGPVLEKNENSDKLFSKHNHHVWARKLQALITPISVEFLLEDWEELDNKESQKGCIHESGSHIKPLQGNVPSGLNFSGRISWAEVWKTPRKEAIPYLILGGLKAQILPIRKEERQELVQMLRTSTNKSGTKYGNFSDASSTSSVSEVEHFAAKKLSELNMTLDCNGSYLTILHDLCVLNKTQLNFACVEGYQESHSASFWSSVRSDNSPRKDFADLAEKILGDKLLEFLRADIVHARQDVSRGGCSDICRKDPELDMRQEFSVNDQLSRAINYQIACKKDGTYCPFAVFSILVLLIYGEVVKDTFEGTQEENNTSWEGVWRLAPALCEVEETFAMLRDSSQAPQDNLWGIYRLSISGSTIRLRSIVISGADRKESFATSGNNLSITRYGNHTVESIMSRILL
ncbi:hypothetical protein BP5796_12919 [Coleophoma crateriformis]|uniref:Heterokaryon incompatibility domain-containing protein n=1 Tax=Coleophoma crateriformis TaxID=565419 RepID=A0A3D8Q4W5_9HELO|nr:hypothetical protein BP5796_12919 [Coleophoma crateriformis]